MHTMELASVDGLEELDRDALLATRGGSPVGPVLWGVGVYLAKTAGDNWGDFKEGIAGGFGAVWGER